MRGNHAHRALGFLAVFAVFVWAVGCGGPSTSGGRETPDGATSGAGTSGASSGAGTGSGAATGSSGSGSSGVGGQSGTASGSSSTGTVDDAAAADPKAACVSYVQAFCERDVQCGGLNPASLSGCTESAALCPDLIFSAGSSRTPSQAQACATDVLAQACDAFNAGVYLPCQSPGTRPAGQPCNYNSQCATFRCIGTQTGACGACAPILGPSDDCVTAPGLCPTGQVCDATGTRRCVLPAAVSQAGMQGEPCGADGICSGVLVCVVHLGADAQAPTCEEPPASGAPCLNLFGPNGSSCAPLNTCHFSPRFGCIASVPEGQACNVVPDGDPCVPGTYCDVGDAGSAGICHANRPAGQPCVVVTLAGGFTSLGGCMSGICAGNVCAPTPPPPPGIGASCGGDAGVCALGLGCDNGICETAACGARQPEAGAD